MSDYLWDRSGETDRDVERLEKTLGRLRYQHRGLELPLEIPVGRPRRAVYWPALAAAAALALMALAGMWFVALRHGGEVETRPAVAQRSPGADGKDEAPEEIRSTSATTGPRENHTGQRAELAPAQKTLQTARGRTPTAGRQRIGADRRPQIASRASSRHHPQPQALSSQTGDEGRVAKEQLMLALRLASAKLNLAQKKAQGAASARPQS